MASYIVYKATNTVNGKGYVGITRKALSKRKSEHKARANSLRAAFSNAIRKYGFDTFTWSILSIHHDDDDLYAAEIAAIKEHRTLADGGWGYNRTAGGGGTVGYRHTAETKVKISSSCAGKKAPPEARANMRKAQRGKVVTDACRAKLRGQKRTPETCAKIGAASLGRKHSAAGKERISAGLTLAWATHRQGPKIKDVDICDIQLLRGFNLSFSAIAKHYDCTSSAIFYALKRERI